ncbi:MAG TPA: hypothetical protein VK110_09715, partial [Salinisphaeraceae bacterium]|nr:hypothetical protein [Salinisphaeraceae bacterium]
ECILGSNPLGRGHFGAIRHYRLLMQRCYKALVAPCLAAKWPLLCGSGNAKKALVYPKPQASQVEAGAASVEPAPAD